MSYPINTVNQKHRSSWMSPAECKAYYKVAYQFREIQIHWWGDPNTKPTHAGVVNYIANKTGGSVNYVTSGGKVTKMVGEENCAITTQNGNPYGIKIECSPYGTDEDYKTVGWLVADIRKRRGNLPLVPHKKYFNTACPGTLSLDRINSEANKYNQGGEMAAPTRQEVINQFNTFQGSAPTEAQIAHYTKPEQGWGALNGDLLQLVFDRYKALSQQGSFKKVEVYIKEGA